MYRGGHAGCFTSSCRYRSGGEIHDNKTSNATGSPDEALAAWVSQDGSTRWTPPNADEVITLEERLKGLEAEDHELRVAAGIRSSLKAEEGSETNACVAQLIPSHL